MTAPLLLRLSSLASFDIDGLVGMLLSLEERTDLKGLVSRPPSRLLRNASSVNCGARESDDEDDDGDTPLPLLFFFLEVDAFAP